MKKVLFLLVLLFCIGGCCTPKKRESQLPIPSWK